MLRRVLVALLIGLGVYALFITGCQRAILFPRHVLPDVTGDRPPAGVERLWRDIDGGQVEAWFIPAPAPGSEGQGARPLVIFAHGNGELIDYWPPMLDRYTSRGLHVLLVEYRGYGRSGGKPSEAGIVDDFVYFYDRVTRRDEVDVQRVIYHGRSLGCGVVAQLAARRGPAAMILESSFTSVADVARGSLVPRFLVRDTFEVRGVIAEADYPVLILHGRDDSVIPVAHAQRNHAACPTSRLVIFNDLNHNDPPPESEYWRTIDGLLAEAGLLPGAAADTMAAPIRENSTTNNTEGHRP